MFEFLLIVWVGGYNGGGMMEQHTTLESCEATKAVLHKTFVMGDESLLGTQVRMKAHAECRQVPKKN